jgi:hypothetical protein
MPPERPDRSGSAGRHGRRERGGLEFRILGPLEVTHGDRAIAFAASKQRALLGVLLLHPGEAFPASA